MTARTQRMTRPQAVGLLHFHVRDTDLAFILTRQTAIAVPPLWSFPRRSSQMSGLPESLVLLLLNPEDYVQVRDEDDG